MFADARICSQGKFAIGKRLVRQAGLLLAGLTLATNVLAAFSSATAVNSSLNPSTAVDSVTFTAGVQSKAYDVRLPLGFGASAGQSLYIRYDLANATFATTVTSTQLNDVTTAANAQSVIVAQAGAVGDTYVVFQVTAGATGLPLNDIFSFLLSSVNAASPTIVPTIAYSLHGTAASAAGQNPANTTVLSSTGAVAVTNYTTAVLPTGTMLFRLDGLAIAGCVAVPLVAAAAQCSLTIATGGNKVVTALYSGDANYAGSTGTLTNGQQVDLAVTTASVTPGLYQSPYTFTFTVVGVSGTAVFTVLQGAVPNGLSLSPAGVLSGTPTATGSAIYIVSVTDGAGVSGSRQYTQNILPASQTLTFSLPASAKAATQLTMNGSASSGLPVSYVSNSPATCVVAGAALRLLLPGICSVTASQLGSPQYNAATPVQSAMTVAAAAGVHDLRVRSAAPQLMKGSLVNGLIQFSADIDPGPNTRLLGTLDFDGNGASDLLYITTAPTPGGFVDVHTWRSFLAGNDQTLRSVKIAWDVQALGDVDGDGFDDIVWRYTTPGTPDTGVSYVWFSNGTGVGEVRKRGAAPLDWTLLGARDLNGDGAADVVYISPAGQVRVLMATAARSCANFAAGAIPAGFSVLRLADFTGNRRGDILLRNTTTGEVRLMTLDASALMLPPSTANPNDPNASCTATTAVIASAPVVLPLTPANWTYYGSVDFNGDGIADIVWKLPDGSLTLWMMNAFGAPPTVTVNAGTAPAGFTVLEP